MDSHKRESETLWTGRPGGGLAQLPMLFDIIQNTTGL